MFDFVWDKANDFVCPPHPLRTTVAHSGTVMFDPESEAIVFDMVSSLCMEGGGGKDHKNAG